MDVYVVINQGTGCPGVVIGAGADIDAAYEIADRSGDWPDGVVPKWFVDLETGVHSRRWAGVWQEIVRVPLAGGKGWLNPFDSEDRLPAGSAAEEISEIGRDFGAP